VDLRPALHKVAGQEVLTSDGVGVRATVVVRSAVTDPLRWALASEGVAGGAERLYLAAQLALRDAVARHTAEQLIAARSEVSALLLDAIREAGVEVGATVEAADLRDLSFPGELRKVFAQVAIARQESAASRERARRGRDAPPAGERRAHSRRQPRPARTAGAVGRRAHWRDDRARSAQPGWRWTRVAGSRAGARYGAPATTLTLMSRLGDYICRDGDHGGRSRASRRVQASGAAAHRVG
jgi:hypothetical protein